MIMRTLDSTRLTSKILTKPHLDTRASPVETYSHILNRISSIFFSELYMHCNYVVTTL